MNNLQCSMNVQNEMMEAIAKALGCSVKDLILEE